MKCKKCGATLLDTDTFCSECGEKVVIDKCPQCGEKLRDGVKFCSKCGYRLGSPIDYSKKVPEDEDIPVTGQMATDDIPFDLIEKNIILDTARQLTGDEDEKKTVKKNHKQEIYDSDADYPEDNYDSYSSEEEYGDEEEYDDEYDYDEYPEDYEDSDYDDEPEEKSVLSRLFTAGIIVLGLIIILGIAALFFNSRKNSTSDEEETVAEEAETEEDNEEETEVSDGTIGTITVTSDVNIRDYPSTENSTVLDTAKTGDTFSYYGYAEGSDSWVHIKVDDNTDGYVYKEYVSIDQ